MNTVEGASVFTALAVTVGLIIAGFSTVAAAGAASSLARDVARVQALGGDGQALAAQRNPQAQVQVTQVTLAGQPAIAVDVRIDAPLRDATAHAEVIAEPDS